MAVILLVLGDGGAPTGYSRVIASILRNLPKNNYIIHHLAVNYHGDPHEEDWSLYPAASKGHPFGVNRVKELVESTRPDIVLSVADLWIQKLYLNELCSCDLEPKIVLYSPVDAGPVDPEWVERFGIATKVVAFTRYARAEILKAFGERQHLDIDVIPLGIDKEIFCPLSEITPWSTIEAKQMLKIFETPDLESSFLVLNAHRNQPRKRIDITLKGFALFAQGKPSNVQLYLHMGVEDVGWNVLKLARRYGIDNRLVLTGSNGMPHIDTKQLNIVYNACDVGINTSTGEGWGLPNWEHAATGKAQIVPRIGALEEIWGECGHLVEPEAEVVYEGVLSEGKVLSAKAVAVALELLYENKQLYTRIAESCYNKVSHPQYSWKAIGVQWDKVLSDTLTKLK
jgi:glycosyltransferase involved in cell wall biosynthesis